MEVNNAPVINFPKSSETAVEPVKVKTETQAEQKPQHAEEKVTKETLETRVEGMNEFLQPTSTAVKFKLHEELNEYYVQVINPVTDEVLKEIPNKKFLDMYASMTELMGLVVDEKR